MQAGDGGVNINLKNIETSIRLELTSPPPLSSSPM